ncbi:MAG TPA: AmmeMemoRadiSam system protein A, partial [Thermoanaerobacterales bacterium]|nr:AmmeMemoRadiSam system protein A [Thermoanaerobacterales bacterium]
HPPIMIPEIGGKEVEKIRSTFQSAVRASKNINEYNPDTIIVITPHGPVFRDGICISTSEDLHGNFTNFGVRGLDFSFINDIELVETIMEKAEEKDILTAPLDANTARSYGVSVQLDHGTLVPFYFISKETKNPFKLVHITMGLLPYEELYTFGKVLRESLDALGRKGIIVASGDLSHRLTPDAPAGYNPSGKEFDEKLVNALRNYNIEDIMNMDPNLIDKAGECGLRPIIILMGALDGLDIEPEVFSYEGPFGVGYCIAEFKIKGEGSGKGKAIKQSSPYVSLARKSLETYVKEGLIIDPPEGLPNEFYNKKAGAFVTIKKHGRLRGCIGTIAPTRDCIAREIIENAISAGCGDPRFYPVGEDELPYLEYSVDILLEPEPVSSIEELDPKRYGVIVRKGSRTGLLLPDLEGVDTPEEQVAIACQKAGIRLDEDFELERFEVIRHF